MAETHDKVADEEVIEYASSIEIILDAIARRKMLGATYNGSAMTLAPHQLFVRNQSIYLGAVNPNKRRRSDEEPAIGHFNISGLFDLVQLESAFEPLGDFDGQLPRVADQPIACVCDA